MGKIVFTPEELKQKNVLNIDLDESKQLRKFISAVKRWIGGKQVDIAPGRVELVIELLGQSVEYLSPTEQGLLEELTKNFSCSVEEIASDKGSKYGDPELYDLLIRKLCYLLKLEGKKQADDMIRACRALCLLESAQNQFPEQVKQ